MNMIATTAAPAAIGPYSQGVIAGGLVFTSGQIPVDPSTGAVAGDTITTQAEQSCKNVLAVLEAAGAGADKVVKTTCFLRIWRISPRLTKFMPPTSSPSRRAAASPSKRSRRAFSARSKRLPNAAEPFQACLKMRNKKKEGFS
jgi:enamine deaminase RidA (YjgF/YER057c/UK114 family)